MEWIKVLVTWVNCLCENLNIKKITKIQELHNESKFFKDVITKIRKNEFDRVPKEKILQMFLESACPEIISEKFEFNPSHKDFEYPVSIFLAITALEVEEPDFKTPLFEMDDTTQKAVEKFLSTILSNDMKRDSLNTAIANAVKVVREDSLRIPVSQMRSRHPAPNSSPLKDFFSSPVLRRTSINQSADSSINRELEEEMHNLKVERSELKNSLREKDSVIISLRQRLEAVNNEVEDLKEVLTQEETARQSAVEMNRLIEHARSELNEALEKLVTIESKSLVLRRTSINQSADSSINRELEEEMHNLKVERSELKNSLREKDSVIISLRQRLEAVNNEVEDLKEVLTQEETARQSAVEMNRLIEHARSELNEALEKLVTIESKNMELEESNTILENENDRLRKELEERRLADLKEEMGKTEEEKKDENKEEGEEFEVETILRIKANRKTGENQYLVRWKGYSSKYDSWVKEPNMNCRHLLAEFFEREKQLQGSKTDKDT